MNESSNSRVVGQLLPEIRKRAPVIDNTLENDGSMPVCRYVQKIIKCSGQSFQPRDDLGEVVRRYLEPLLGQSIAEAARDNLLRKPAALTANHHGVDYFAQSVQGTLLFSLAADTSTIPVFACGNIPLNNLTYPRGMLLYPYSRFQPGTSSPSTQAHTQSGFPVKVPLFPDRLKHTLVACAPPLDLACIQRAQQKVQALCADKQMATVADVALELLNEDYGCEEVLSQTTHSDQAVIINQRLWHRLFADQGTAPTLVYLEMEKITTMLLEYDFLDPDSLVSILFMNPLLRHDLSEGLKDINGSGTFLFWGIDAAGRRISLSLASDNGGAGILRNGNGQNSNFEIPFEPLALLLALRAGRILPSLFTNFLVIALARGVNCLGGYYQAAYLPQMQRCILSVLQKHFGTDSAFAKIANVPTSSYLSGMQAVVTEKDSCQIPAGPVEIAAAGGLTGTDLAQICTLTVAEAHIASLLETTNDVMAGSLNTLPEHWQHQLARECQDRLRGAVVTLSF